MKKNFTSSVSGPLIVSKKLSSKTIINTHKKCASASDQHISVGSWNNGWNNDKKLKIQLCHNRTKFNFEIKHSDLVSIKYIFQEFYLMQTFE